MTTVRVCELCSGPNLRPSSRWCGTICKGRSVSLRAGVDCSVCGGRIMRGKGVLRDGTAKCRACRRANPRKRPVLWPRDVECARCRQTFSARTPDNRWCSPTCRRTRDCTGCGSEFLITDSGTQYRRVECDACTRLRRSIARKKNWPRINVYFRDCAGCGRLFATAGNRKRCSDDCKVPRKSYYKPRPRTWVEVGCAQCGVRFSTARKTKYCADPCRRRAGRIARKVAGGKFKLTFAARESIYERDGFDCHLCGHPVADVDDPHPWAPTLDHLVPRSLGGTNDPENLRTAHRWCNSVRGVAPVPAKLYPLPPMTWDAELFLTIRGTMS